MTTRTSALLGVGMAAFAVTAAMCSSVAVAAFPGGNGRIAYQSYADGLGGAMFTVLPRGSGMSQLTSVPPDTGRPSWSADGRRLVFARAVGARHQLLTVDPNGNKLTTVVDHGYLEPSIGSPSFSPNGRRIMYTTGRTIRTVRTDGTRDRRLLTGGLSHPRYAPSGRRIVFVGTPQGRRRNGIWTARRDGSHLRRLTNPARTDPAIGDASPDYSPNGRNILFSRYEDRTGSELVLMRATGRHKRSIPDTGNVGAAVFAPNGKRIAVPVYTEPDGYLGPSCSDLFTMTRRGTGRRRLTTECGADGLGHTVVGVAWQPVPRKRGER